MTTFKVYAIGSNNYSNWWLEHEGKLTLLGAKDRGFKELVSWPQAVEKARYFLQHGELKPELCPTCGHHTFRPKGKLPHLSTSVRVEKERYAAEAE
jgi:hypothetical protein